jgi:NADH dehydrogenase/NADH:ubiquinone oxidoreductase subunit G
MLSNEALFLLGRLVKRLNGKGWFTVPQGPEAPLDGVPDLALRSDRAANVKGAELFGFSRTNDVSSVLAGLGDKDVLLVADEELAGHSVPPKAGAIVVIGTTQPAWTGTNPVVLPTTNMAEEEGTFTNLRGRVQRYLQAKAPPGESRPTYAVLSDVLIAAGEPANYMIPSEVFAALAASHPSFSGMSYDTLALKGAVIK